MAKKDIFRDSLVKISRVFLNDIFVINNKYIIGGKKSEENTRGYYLCLLSNKIIEEFNKIFEENKIFYISDIKKAKDDIFSYIKEIKSDKEIQDVSERVQYIYKKINIINTWNTLNIDKDLIDKMFLNSESIELFHDNENINTVILSKSMLPMITEKNIDKLYFTPIQTDENELNELMFNIDTDYFQLYMLYKYL